MESVALASVSSRPKLASVGRFLAGPPFCVAVVLTLLNVPKPLHIDDTAYYFFAEHIAQDPLRPYDFPIFWGQAPVPAMEVLAPPVLPYWWALGIRLFGETPWAWKLWLFPFCLILTTSLWAIFRRFAPGLATSLLWLTAISPALLPAVNLMLDMPALALNLGSLAIFFRAVDRRSMALALLAGLVGGLAAQTKYTGLTALGAILVYAILYRRVGLGLVAGLAGAFVFGSIEGLIALVHGQSHLLSNIGRQAEGAAGKRQVVIMLLPLLGAMAPVVIMVGLAGLQVARRWVLTAGFVVLAGLASSGLVAQMAEPYLIQVRFWQAQGILALAVAAFVALKLIREKEDGTSPADRPSTRTADLFLVSWVALEVASFVVLTTFPAARRVMGIVVAMTALNGCLASRACLGPARKGVLPWVMAVGLAFGGLYYYVDLREALAEKQAVEDVSGWVRGRDAGARIWYVGHWGFQFYAGRNGLQAVLPGRSRLEPGDWLVMPDQGIDQQQMIEPSTDEALLERTFVLDGKLGCRTVPSAYYNGKLPILANRDPWIRVYVYRVVGDFVPAIPRQASR
jgi:hypothetical protein